MASATGFFLDLLKAAFNGSNAIRVVSDATDGGASAGYLADDIKAALTTNASSNGAVQIVATST